MQRSLRAWGSLALAASAIAVMVVWLVRGTPTGETRTTLQPRAEARGSEPDGAADRLVDPDVRTLLSAEEEPEREEPLPAAEVVSLVAPDIPAPEPEKPRREQLPDSHFEEIYRGWAYEELNERYGEVWEKMQSEQARLLEERYQAGLYTIISPHTVVTGGNEVIQARSDWVDEPGGEKQYSAVYLPADEYPEFYALWDEWAWLMKTTNKMADERIENVVDVRDL